MNRHYEDILSRIAEPPHWFDENAVPRYVAFAPDEAANIYADEVVLLWIDCQACGRRFDVCLSRSRMGVAIASLRGHALRPLASEIQDGSIHYGDPPNVNCCPSGPTMNSEPRRVVQYWKRGGEHRLDWVRDAALEINIREVACAPGGAS